MKHVRCKELKDTMWGKFLAVFLAFVFALAPFNAAALAETFNPENQTVSYSTQAELDAAFEAVGAVLENGDIQGGH